MLILTLLIWYLTKLKNKKLGFLFKFFSKNLVETKNIVSSKKFSRPVDIMNKLVFCHQNQVFLETNYIEMNHCNYAAPE